MSLRRKLASLRSRATVVLAALSLTAVTLAAWCAIAGASPPVRQAPVASVLITNRDLPSFFPGGYLTFSEEAAVCERNMGLARGWVMLGGGQDALYRGGLIETAGVQSVFSQALLAPSIDAARRTFSNMTAGAFSRCLVTALDAANRRVGTVPTFSARPLASPRFGQRSSTKRVVGTLYASAPGVVANAIDDDLTVIQQGRFVGTIGLEAIVAGPPAQLRPFPTALRVRLGRLMAARMAHA